MNFHHLTPPPLEGKLALVMNANRGIGAEIARAHAAAGAIPMRRIERRVEVAA